MQESQRRAGEIEILAIARHVAEEFASSHSADIRIVGWIGSTGHQGWEFAVEVDGKGFGFEVGETQVMGISSGEKIRREVEERIRNQMQYAVANRPTRNSARPTE